MRAVFLGENGFPTFRVREGEHEGLILPEFPEIFDEHQAHPISDTRDWLDAVFTVNAHLRPETNYGSFSIARLCMSGTAIYGITEIRRLSMNGGRVQVHQLVAPAKTLSNKDSAVLEIASDPPMSLRASFDGKELFDGQLSEQHTVRDTFQPIAQRMLRELGYGDPDEFAREAVELTDYRADERHPIVWPRPLNFAPLRTDQVPSDESPR